VKLSVIVPTFKDSDAAATTGICIARQMLPDDELFIVDNGSPPAHVKACETFASTITSNLVTVLVCTSPGSYAARNFGAERATGDVLVFTDSGCEPQKDWLASVRDHFRNRPESRVTGPIEMTYSSKPPKLVELVDARMHLNQDSYVQQGWAATANMAILHTAFVQLQGFRLGLKSGGDYEFGIRAMAAGHRIGWSPQMIVRHEARDSFEELLKKRRRIRAGHSEVAALPGFAQALRQVQAIPWTGEKPTPRAYPGVGGVQWELTRVARRLLREYEKFAK
jgi:glycosyltransferase involved in cell wall biosynthesis